MQERLRCWVVLTLGFQSVVGCSDDCWEIAKAAPAVEGESHGGVDANEQFAMLPEALTGLRGPGLALVWLTPNLGSFRGTKGFLAFPEYGANMVGDFDAATLGASLCWCPKGRQACAFDEPGNECAPVTGTLSSRRHSVNCDEKGCITSLDFSVDVAANSDQVTFSARLDVKQQDRARQVECPETRWGSIISFFDALPLHTSGGKSRC